LSKGLDVKVTPFADDAKTFKGTITSINPVVDDKGQIQVRARINNDGSLIDGMNVKIVIERMIHDMLVIPKSAVVSRDNQDVLFKYSNDGKAHWTYIDILYSNGDSYAVTQNNDRNAILEEGDTIIVSDNLNLADMSDVKIKDN
jgi:multidrug efflux pump subunit AcrA (membrane-fusion protein)